MPAPGAESIVIFANVVNGIVNLIQKETKGNGLGRHGSPSSCQLTSASQVTSRGIVNLTQEETEPGLKQDDSHLRQVVN